MVVTTATTRCCWCGKPFRRSGEAMPWLCWTPTCWDRIHAHSLTVPQTDARGTIKRNAHGDPLIKTWLFAPLPRQVDFMTCGAKYRMFGGAAGPGKGHGARWWLYSLALEIPGFEALILRETLGEIRRTHLRRMIHEAPLLGLKPPTQTPPFELRFPNGSLIELGGMDDAAAVQRYLSTEYDVIVPDEASKYDPSPLFELSTRARTKNAAVKTKLGSAVFAPVTNPGGPSSQMLVDLFITHEPDYELMPGLRGKYKPERWVATPATLDDNPYLDPDYADTLAVLNPARYQQLRYGDWFAIGGQFFPHFSVQTHGRVVTIPRGAEWVEAMDWGYSSNGALGFFAHVGDGYWHCARGVKFKGMEPPEVAALITETRRALGYEHPRYGVADPSIFSKHRGESIAETFRRCGVVWRPAVNTRSDPERELGWPRLGAWFRPDPATGVPWLTFDPHGAAYFLRSIAGLMPDPNNPEDVNTHMDDHPGDCSRYWAMSRPPVVGSAVVVKGPPKPGSIGAMVAELVGGTRRVLGAEQAR